MGGRILPTLQIIKAKKKKETKNALQLGQQMDDNRKLRYSGWCGGGGGVGGMRGGCVSTCLQWKSLFSTY